MIVDHLSQSLCHTHKRCQKRLAEAESLARHGSEPKLIIHYLIIAQTYLKCKMSQTRIHVFKYKENEAKEHKSLPSFDFKR